MKKIGQLFLATLLTLGTISMAHAEGDAANGQKVFKKCMACHTVDKGGKNKAGPNLYGIVGHKAASIEGFRYSKAMEASGLTWDEATLDEYLANPRATVPGTKMSFAGLKKEQDRLDVIAYLKTLKD